MPVIEHTECTVSYVKTIEQEFAKTDSGSLADRVYTALRRAILHGDIPPQTKLGEAELTSVLPVSRTPLREAFRQLEAERLVIPSPSRGVVVRGLSAQELYEVYQTLTVLESYAVELAVQNLSDDDLKEMQDHIDLSRFYAERERWDDMLRHSMAFHAALTRGCGNSYLTNMIGDLREITHSFRRFQLRSVEEWMRGIDQHQELLDAVRTRDPELASKRMRIHLEGSTRLLMSQLEDESA